MWFTMANHTERLQREQNPSILLSKNWGAPQSLFGCVLLNLTELYFLFRRIFYLYGKEVENHERVFLQNQVCLGKFNFEELKFLYLKKPFHV